MMVIDNKFEIGQIVYVITDEDQRQRIITSITIGHGGVLSYGCAQGNTSCDFYDIEISDKQNILAKI